jgi:hypothetical protein
MGMSSATRSRFVGLLSTVVYDEDDRAVVSCALETIARLCYCHENVMWLEEVLLYEPNRLGFIVHFCT